MSAGTTRDRFLQDPVPIRLGNLASNLSRIETFSDLDLDHSAVAGVIEESLHFVEWTAPDVDPSSTRILSDLSADLQRWQGMLAEQLRDPAARRQMADQAGAWSERLLKVAGLI